MDSEDKFRKQRTSWVVKLSHVRGGGGGGRCSESSGVEIKSRDESNSREVKIGREDKSSGSFNK